MTFLRTMKTMFGGSSEEEICAELQSAKNMMRIQAAACDPRLPGSSIGYIDQLQRAKSLSVAEDAVAQIRKHIPDFLKGVV